MRPVTSTKTASRMASSTLSWEIRLMPLSTPLTAEIVAMTTAITINEIWTARPCGRPNTMSRPTFRLTTPMPRDVATPKIVPSTAAVSAACPIGPSTRLPMSGYSAERTASGRFIR